MFHPESLVNEMVNLRKFAMRLTKNASDADDLTQSTVLRALEKKEYFQEGSNIFKWTSKIMFNLFVSQYRRNKKFQTQCDPVFFIEQMSVESSQEANVDLRTVMEVMQRISFEHREILILVCIKGLCYDEVAQRLQIPVGTVRSRLSRARGQLRNMLEPVKHSDSIQDNQKWPTAAERTERSS